MILFAFLFTFAHAQTRFSSSEVAVKALEQILATTSNPYNEFYCQERAVSSSGSASAACQDLHAFSCSQGVVRDPLSASYAIDDKLKGFAISARAPIMKSIGESLQQVALATPDVKASLESIDKFTGSREKTLDCIYAESIDRIDMIRGSLPPCPGFANLEAWDVLSMNKDVSGLKRVVAEAISKFVLDSEKHKTVTTKIFPKAKQLIVELMEQQASLNPQQAVVFNQMRDRLKQVELQEPQSKWVYEESQMYANTAQDKVICNHSSVVKGNFSDIAHGIIHELGHSIDPCRGEARVGALKGESEFPLKNILACLERETDLDMGKMVDGEFDCSNAGESFPDFLATLLLPKLLPVIYGDLLKTPNDYAQVYSGIGRSFMGFCEDVTDGSHPSWAKRINQLVASNPVIRTQMGCGDTLVPASACFTEVQLPIPSGQTAADSVKKPSGSGVTSSATTPAAQ